MRLVCTTEMKMQNWPTWSGEHLLLAAPGEANEIDAGRHRLLHFQLVKPRQVLLASPLLSALVACQIEPSVNKKNGLPIRDKSHHVVGLHSKQNNKQNN